MSKEPYYPHGKKYEDDEGELAIRIAVDPAAGVVRIDFGKPIQWIALEPAQALGLAELIARKASALLVPPAAESPP